MTAKEIIEAVMKHLDISMTELARSIGTGKQNIYNIVNGNTKNISPKMAELITAKYPEISRGWLYSGDGEMFTEGQKQKADGNGGIVLPVFNLDSVGGLHSGNLEIGPEYIERHVTVPDGNEKDILIYQSGNSMSPDIPPGSLLQIREVEEWRDYIGYGNVFVLVLKDGRRITKQIQRYEENPKEYFWCVSYNPDVADEELPKKMVHKVWKVIRILIDRGW